MSSSKSEVHQKNDRTNLLAAVEDGLGRSNLLKRQDGLDPSADLARDQSRQNGGALSRRESLS